MGILIGVNLSKKNMRVAQAIMGFIFGAIFIVLMLKVYGIIIEVKSDSSDL